MSERVEMVAEVRRLLDEPLGEHGGDRRNGEVEQGSNITLNRGTGEDYTRRRLRRDRPELYERVRVPVRTGSSGNSSFTRARASELPIEPVPTGTGEAFRA